ncbi:MAG: SpoIID/LytB domain-containing protein [Brevinema sp.]
MKNTNYLLFLFLLVISCKHAIKPTNQHAYIETRILLSSAPMLSVNPKNYYLISLGDKKLYTKGSLSFNIAADGIVLNGVHTKLNQIDLQGVELFYFDGKQYRGSLSVYHKGTHLYLVNKLNLEDYLLSVVPSEVYTSWNLDTLKAQAIASRTYALYEIKRIRRDQPNQEFDLYADTRSQVYSGMITENKKTTQAINDTIGEVLTYKGQLIKSYFSASVGDRSADGSEIGDMQDYLQSRSLNIPKMKHPHIFWESKISSDKIARSFQLTQPLVGIKILSRTSSGRIQNIQLLSLDGKTKIISANYFRQKLGYQFMKSTYADLRLSNNEVFIKGKGFGHGVGMGQWEAQELSKRGISYPKILTYFYKDTRLSYLY